MSWTDNSLGDFRNNDPGNNELAMLTIAVTTTLLIHSAYLHGTKLKTVRILTDMSSFAGLIAALGCLLSTSDSAMHSMTIILC